MFTALFRRRAVPDIDRLYGTIMATALAPVFYARLAVPDTFEGRFECASLHMALVLRHLKGLPAPAGEAAQALVDRFFDGLDSAIRERGIGDVAVPRRMKRFMQGFYGRLNAYTEALAVGAPSAELPEALARNLLGGAEPSPDLVACVRHAAARLATADLGALMDRPQVFFAECEEGKTP